MITKRDLLIAIISIGISSAFFIWQKNNSEPTTLSFSEKYGKKGETGNRSPVAPPLYGSINALANEYLHLAYHGLRAKNKDFNSDFKTDFDPNLPKVAVIPQDMGRVLLNLMNNAFYAVSKNVGKVKPTMELAANIKPSQFIITTLQSDNHIIIKVKDNGVGMPQSVKAKIFQPFFTTKPTGEGTGLGLSLAYDIVTKGHSGTIEVESVEDEWTEFTIKLPIILNT